MAFSLLIQSFNFMSADTSGVLAVFCLAMYLICFSLGMGPGKFIFIPNDNTLTPL